MRSDKNVGEGELEGFQDRTQIKGLEPKPNHTYDILIEMTPREFLVKVVQPNIAEFHRHYTDMRHVHNAISAIDALAGYIYRWCVAEFPKNIEGSNDDTKYRDVLAGRNREFFLLREIAKAQKHVRLTRGEPVIRRVGNVRPFRFGEMNLGRDRFGSSQIVVDLDSGGFEYVTHIIETAVALLDAEMAQIGI